MKFSQWLSLIVLAVCLYILWQIRNVLLLGITAIIFAVVMNRAVVFLQRWIHSRKVAMLVLSLLVLLVVGIFSAVIGPQFVHQIQELIDLTPQVIEQIRGWFNGLQQTLPFNLLPGGESIDSLLNRLQSLDLEMLFGRFFTLFSNTLTLTLNVLLVVVLTLMFLLSPDPYRHLFVKAFPASVRPQVWQIMDRCESAIAGWFIGILFNMTVIALMSTVGLLVLGIPLPLANGLLAGILAFIPNIGPVTSVIPPAAIALLETPWKTIAVILLYVLIQQLESNVLTPMVMQKQVSLLPAVTLLSQVIFTVFFGILGLFLALPLTLILQQWLETFWVDGFLEQH